MADNGIDINNIPYEENREFRRLQQEYGLTNRQAADLLGRSVKSIEKYYSVNDCNRVPVLVLDMFRLRLEQLPKATKE